MDANEVFISIIMPALNEEKNILPAIDDVLTALKDLRLKGEIVVINDGSTDNTPSLIKRKIEELPDVVRMVNHNTPKGVGASFWDGVDYARGNFVCLMPGDNEAAPGEILRYVKLLEDVDIVIPFSFNKGIRSAARNAISSLYRFAVNTTFLTSFNYTNGTSLYRKELLKNLGHRCGSFFFQADILVRLAKRGYLFAEVPYALRARKEGKSKAISLKSLYRVIRDYIRLVKDIYFCRTERKVNLSPGSVSFTRRSEIER